LLRRAAFLPENNDGGPWAVFSGSRYRQPHFSIDTISPLRQRMIDLNPHTQRIQIGSYKRFAAHLKRSPHTAS
jgi:hypothetical protein